MQIWYKTFPKSRALPFHIAGESYGGHYIPIFAKHIVDENAKSPKHEEVPLKSLMIGNGIFDPLRQATSSWVSSSSLHNFFYENKISKTPTPIRNMSTTSKEARELI